MIWLLALTCFAGGIGCEGMDRGQSRHCLSAVEIYNPDGDYWREGPPLPCPQLSLRTNASNAGVVGGKIYVCGYYKGAGTSRKSTLKFAKLLQTAIRFLSVSYSISDRHDDITKDILELDPWENRWTVVTRHAVMHDNYDVCLVASLNPRGLISPPSDLMNL